MKFGTGGTRERIRLGASDEWLSRGHRLSETCLKSAAAGREDESLFGKMGTVTEGKALSKRKPILRGTEGSNPAPSTGESVANLTPWLRTMRGT